MGNFDELNFATTFVVYTWGEYKKYALPIILSSLDSKCSLEEDEAKRSFTSGQSFDRTCDEFEKSLKKHENNYKLTEKDKSSLIKILSKYKGKKSDEKLKKMESFVKYLSDLKEPTVQDVENKFEKLKEEGYGKKVNKYCEFRQSLNNIVAKLKDGDVVDTNGVKKISALVSKYEKFIDEPRLQIVKVMNDGLNINAESIVDDIKRFESNKDKPLGTNRKFTARNVAIFLGRYNLHKSYSEYLSNFCGECRNKLDEYINDNKRIVSAGDPESWEKIEESNKKLEGDYAGYVAKMQQFVEEAKKLQ